jgi:hypothetical protein
MVFLSLRLWGVPLPTGPSHTGFPDNMGPTTLEDGPYHVNRFTRIRALAKHGGAIGRYDGIRIWGTINRCLHIDITKPLVNNLLKHT